MRRPYWILLLTPAGLVSLLWLSAGMPTPNQHAEMMGNARASSLSAPTPSHNSKHVKTPPELRTHQPHAYPRDLPPPQLTSLRGARVPDGLRADADGNLVKDRELRLFFDFFLAASQDESAADMQQLVQQWIQVHLSPRAAAQAVDVWQRYQSYLDAFAQWQQTESLPATASQLTQQDLDRIAAAFQARQQLQQQWLPDVADSWFADDNTYDQNQLALTRAALASGGQHTGAAKTSAPAWQAADNPEYQNQLAQIQQNPGLSTDDRQQLEDQLRHQYFPDRTAYIHQALRDLSH